MTKEEIAQTLFDLCSDRSKSSKYITDKFIDYVGYDKVINKDRIEESIKKYRQRGRGLEELAEDVRNQLVFGISYDKDDDNGLYASYNRLYIKRKP